MKSDTDSTRGTGTKASSAEHAKDGHVHLRLVDPKVPIVAPPVAPPHADAPKAHAAPKWDWARWLVVGVGFASIASIVGSFFLPWWNFKLYAPQYPKGLSLVISLTGMGGDVREIDLLNHYIGMGHLATAAPMERQLAGYGVALIAIVTIVLAAGAGKKLNKLVAIPAISFPIVFIADSFYWLYTFGHNLDPRAPIRMGAFTPEMFGNGKIGQFETFARPDIGFWLAVVAVTLAIVSNFLRVKVCSTCAARDTCGVVCSRAMVLPERAPQEPS